MKNIVLIGMPGTGKSTVGVILAKRLGYGFLDTDILLAETAGRRLPDIIEDEGFERLIEMEGEVGAGINVKSTVIATGGSMIFTDSAMKNLRENGITIWLETPVEELELRLSANSREDRGVAAPAEMTIADIYNQRKPYYEKYSDFRVDCLPGTDNVVHQILEVLEKSVPDML